MINLTTLIFWLIVFVVVFILIISGKARALASAFLNLFIEDMAATPEGAEALFNKKLEEAEDRFRRADSVFKKVAGQKKRCVDNLASLKTRLSTVESQCEHLAKLGDEEGLNIKISERSDILEEIRIHNEKLVTLEAALKDANEAKTACEENVNAIKKQKKQVVSKMKHNRDMKEVYADLEGIGAGDHTSKLLDRVIEKGADLEDLVAGSKEAYESKASTKSRKVDQRLKTSEDDVYKQQLLKKYNKAQ